MRFDRDFRIQIVKALNRRRQFRLTDLRRAVQNLAMQIRDVDFVEVGDADASDTGRREIQPDGATEAAGADDEDGPALQLLLPGLADVRQDEVPRVALALRFAQCH